jgi:hypothetical protein
MSKNRKKINYVAKLTRVMDECEDRWNMEHTYGNATNRLNELHQDDCPRVKELAHIIDMFANSLASSVSCMKRRTLVKMGYELLSLRGTIQKETRKRMKVVDENGKEIKV